MWLVQRNSNKYNDDGDNVAGNADDDVGDDDKLDPH